MTVDVASKLNSQLPRKKFNLQKYFSMYISGIILVLTVLLSFIFFIKQKDALIENSTSSAETFANLLNHRIYRDFIHPAMIERERLYLEKDSVRHRILDAIAAEYIADYSDIVKIKIFNTGGKVIYSTDPSDIGIVNTSDRIREALNGYTASKLTERMTLIKGNESGRGKEYKIDLLEVYVPLYKNIDEPSENYIIGAFEVYKDVSPLFNSIRNEIIKVPMILIFAMGILYLFLKTVVKNADSVISWQHKEIDTYNAELEEAQKIVKTSIDNVIEHESFHVRYFSTNYKLLKCWVFKNCNKTDCPSYKSDDLRCWQTAGTFCGGEVQGQFARKFGDCRKCEVYNHAVKDRISMIGESFNNMMKLLDNKHRELQKANEKLNTLIDIDPLTQIGNRRSFQKRIENIRLLSLRYNHPYSIIICDVDNFKLYNDTYGHQAGDDVLISVAKTMKESIRKTDEISRWGGEEFIVILPKQNHADALKVAENLRASVFNLGIKHQKNDIQAVSISCGVASFFPRNTGDDGWEYVVKQADDALYKAKIGKKNCVYSATSKIGKFMM